jgi:UDP-N-acetylmuramate--alanine ligase
LNTFEKIKLVYFLGIGGIGMSAIARYFKHFGKEVYGYDKTETELTNELTKEGHKIHYHENPQQLKEWIYQYSSEELLFVYTPAIPQNHQELTFLLENNIKLYKRAEVLGKITESFKTIAVAGTHGKTTTSSMIAHLLRQSGINTFAFLGGITKNYDTNLILGNSHTSENTWVVVEADEYDRSFLTLSPDIAIITSVDADHLDIYGNEKYMIESYNLFAKLVEKNGCLIVKNTVDKTIGRIHPNQITYSLNSKTDITASDIVIKNGNFQFNVNTKLKSISNLKLGMPGLHNVENCVAVCAVAECLGITETKINAALSSFQGVKRRFDYRIKSKKIVFIDDYAHHPEELKACINSIKQIYPDKKITGIFQPHLFTRTRDFADDFAKSLDLLDDCILLEIYPARELPINGVNSQMLLNKMRIKNKVIIQKEKLIEHLLEKEIQVLVTLGAGDIDKLVAPIEEILRNKVD